MHEHPERIVQYAPVHAPADRVGGGKGDHSIAWPVREPAAGKRG